MFPAISKYLLVKTILPFIVGTDVPLILLVPGLICFAEPFSGCFVDTVSFCCALERGDFTPVSFSLTFCFFGLFFFFGALLVFVPLKWAENKQGGDTGHISTHLQNMMEQDSKFKELTGQIYGEKCYEDNKKYICTEDCFTGNAAPSFANNSNAFYYMGRRNTVSTRKQVTQILEA